jgi:hypothetical protein
LIGGMELMTPAKQKGAMVMKAFTTKDFKSL